MREQDCYRGNSHGYVRRPLTRARAAVRRSAMTDGVGVGVVARARDAAAQGDWQQAFDLLTEEDANGRLASIDLPLLGEVAYAAGHLDVAIEAWERAHT